MTSKFNCNEYHTPAGIPVPLPYRLPLGRGFCFHSAFVGGLLRRSRHLAVRGKFDDQAHEQAGLEYLEHIERAGGKFHVSGLDNLKVYPGPVVIVANHMSLCETFVVVAMVVPHKGKHSFVIKENLAKYPLFGPVVSSTHPILVTRKKPREDFKKVILEGTRFIEEGRSITIFPQTKRSQVFRASEFNTIGEKLAARAGVPVIPLALRTDFLAPGKIILDFGPIHPERPLYFEFGPPLAPGGNAKEKHQKIIDFIGSRLEQWGVPCES